MLKENFRTYDLAKELYQEVEKLKFERVIKDQLHRASLSIVLNLSEGSGKITEKDRRRFFSIALGSARECRAIFDLIQNKRLMKKADSIAAMTYCLCLNPGHLIPK